MDATSSVVERIAPTNLVDPSKAAERLGTTPSTLAVWRSTGRQKLPYVKVGGLVRYRVEDLDAFITKHLVAG